MVRRSSLVLSMPGVNTKENFPLLLTFFVGLSSAFDVELQTTLNRGGDVFFRWAWDLMVLMNL